MNSDLPPYIYAAEQSERSYFCINDAAPHTILFCTPEGKRRFGADAVFYFLGLGGKASNSMLASMYDWGNFVARCSPNVSLQLTFLATLLRQNPLGDLYRSYHFLRDTFIARSVFAAHYLMDPLLPRHRTAISLLQNLFPLLGRFQHVYQQMRL